MAAILLVPNSLHAHGNIDQAPLEVLIDWHTKRKVVRASEDLPAGSLALPPCVPQTSRVYDKSCHPHRVPVTVTERSAVVTAVADGGKLNTRKTGKATCDPSAISYYVQPEYKMPEESKDNINDGAASHVRAWGFKGDDAMHPFWVVELSLIHI